MDCCEFELPARYGSINLTELAYTLRLCTEKDTEAVQLLQKKAVGETLVLSCTVSADMTAVSGSAWLTLTGNGANGEQIIKFTGEPIVIRQSRYGSQPPAKNVFEALLAQLMGAFAEAAREMDEKLAAADRRMTEFTEEVTAATDAARTQASYAQNVGDELAQKLRDGAFTGERGEKGEDGRDGGVTAPASGYFVLYVNPAGHLILRYAAGDTPPPFEIREDEHLYYSLEGEA